MRLIGTWNSPFVRRAAVSLKLMGLPFEAEQVSVFQAFDAFAAINPVVKAPSLVTDEGVVLMDSGLILEFAERLALPARRLTPDDPGQFLRSQRIIGLALAACEKSVQAIYELKLRPAEKQHGPWLDRVGGQIKAAYRALEAEIADPAAWLMGERPMQADVTTAVAWTFTRFIQPDLASPGDYPKLAAFAARAEVLPEFASTPLA